MSINRTIFSRVAASKKAEIVTNLTTTDLLTITPETITRIVRETGTRQSNSRNKTLRLTLPVSNDWNAEFEGVDLYRGRLFADIYIRYDSTDTTVTIPLDDFLKKGDFRGAVTRTDRYGNPQTYYYRFGIPEKAECLRSILLEYLNRRYKIEPVNN